MYLYGLNQHGQPQIVYVDPGVPCRIEWSVAGGAVRTEERAKLLLRQMLGKMEKQRCSI